MRAGPSFRSSARAAITVAAGLLLAAQAPLRAALPLQPAACCEAADFALLLAQVEELVARDRGLEAKIAIERSVLAPGDADQRFGGDLAYEALNGLRRQVAQAVLAAVPAKAALDRHHTVVLRELHQRGVHAAGSAGSNALFIDLYARPPGEARYAPPILIDCDAAVLTVYVVFEEIERQAPERALLGRLRAAAYGSHMALVTVSARGGAMQVADLNRPANVRGDLDLEWHRAAAYDLAYRNTRGERMVVLAGWRQLLANTWELAAGRLLHRREFGGARRYAEEALRASPDSVGAANNLAVALIHLGLGAQAVVVLHATIERSREPVLLSNLAAAFLQLGQWREASQAADRAISQQPQLAVAYYRRFAARSHLGDSRGARRDFERFRLLAGAGAAANGGPEGAPGAAPPHLVFAERARP